MCVYAQYERIQPHSAALARRIQRRQIHPTQGATLYYCTHVSKYTSKAFKAIVTMNEISKAGTTKKRHWDADIKSHQWIQGINAARRACQDDTAF